jgi:arylsulfatase A-like enzyme
LARFAHRANGDWRGEKADIWEGGHRIPFLARWPGAIRPNSESNELASLADLMATIAAITGIPLPKHSAEDSFNLLPAFLGKNTSPIRDSVILHSIDGMFSIHQGNWKLEEGLGSGGFSPPRTVEPAPGGPKGQLYDLAIDPGELHNPLSGAAGHCRSSRHATRTV